MKKLLIVLLALSLLFVFAACTGGNTNTDEDTTNEDVQKADDPESPIIEEVIGDPAELQEALGISIVLPEEYPVSEYRVIDEYMAQVAFYVGTNQAIARVAKGQYDNMSGLTTAFDLDETVTVSGLSVRLRYADPAAEALYDADKNGVADAYDAANDLSYMVYIYTNATKADLTAAMEALIAGSSVVSADDSTVE
jgi:hypothetical protein